MIDNCPICSSLSKVKYGVGGQSIYEIDCPRCGTYLISDVEKSYLASALNMNNKELIHYSTASAVSHMSSSTALYIEVAKKTLTGDCTARSIVSNVIRRRTNKEIHVTIDMIVDIIRTYNLPTQLEREHAFIAFLGEYLSRTGHEYQVYARQNSEENIYGLLGLADDSGEWEALVHILNALKEKQLISVEYDEETSPGVYDVPLAVTLTLEGWQLYKEISYSFQ